MAGAPVGNQNAVKSKRLFTNALKRALTQGPEKIQKIVDMLIEKAQDGEQWAVRELIDRVDGKAPQPVTGGDDDDNPISIGEIVIRGVAAARDSTTGEG